ncbi:hypothetical protein LSH36_1340g00012 [Paralvinella palmiformis]|uniref:Uncharacterized protein n=1 Tax=Paralvinella palmiformis TaxID=53620 RepID=A0AAD9IT43_9ANNE|nr:hypothetical protein LSH36_1340g00012 [Paralvinella palmiformis]
MVDIPRIVINHICSSTNDPVPSPDDSTTHSNTDRQYSTEIPLDSSDESPAEMSDNPAVCTTATRAAQVLDLCHKQGYDEDESSGTDYAGT